MAHKVESDWSTMDPSDVPKGLRNYLDAPAAALAHSRREQLSLHLNVSRQDFSETGLLKDWRGFAERLGYSASEVDKFARHPSPTSVVLKEWIPQPNTKIGHLLEALCTMERFDILRNTNLMSFIEKDIRGYMRQEQRRREAEERNAINPVQVDQIQSSDDIEVEEHAKIMTVESPGPEGEKADGYAKLTIYDTPGNPAKFDAFLSYTPVDEPFALELMKVLEGQHRIKLCVPYRDLLVGGAYYDNIATVIKERCKKMIIVLSPEYIKSVDCDFQIKYQQALDPGATKQELIPIVYRKCTIPNILRIISYLDYTDFTVIDWFWDRLAASVRQFIAAN